jgi:hypothetical protein
MSEDSASGSKCALGLRSGSELNTKRASFYPGVHDADDGIAQLKKVEDYSGLQIPSGAQRYSGQSLSAGTSFQHKDERSAFGGPPVHLLSVWQNCSRQSETLCS